MKDKHIYKAWPAIILVIASLFVSCDESTGLIGVVPQQDAVSTDTASFDILSNDMLNAVVPANSATCYLGKVIDPETDEAITAAFAAQFHTFENYSFPAKENIIKNGSHLCESIEIRLFIKNTFGDKNNPMKIEVWPLSRDDDKLLKESITLYTNTDLWQFVDESNGPVATKVFTATDYIMSDEQRASSSYSSNVRIVLDPKLGDEIMEAYYNNPASFRDSYSFIRDVCAGYLFRTVSGTGTMLNIEVCTININFNYINAAGTAEAANCRFAATPEVIQCTQFESSNLAGLIGNEGYTMLKTPAGICTELVLPIDDIFDGHENDSIVRASFTLTRINNQDEDAQNDDYALDIPQNLLLVRKQNFNSFFAAHQVSDNLQSFTTSFLSSYNCYNFDNIGQLITYCHNEKKKGMEASGLTEEQWVNNNPDWNHVVLVPVTIASATDSYGYTTEVSVNQDLGLCSTKLVRGTATNPIKMRVIYSHFAGE